MVVRALKNVPRVLKLGLLSAACAMAACAPTTVQQDQVAARPSLPALSSSGDYAGCGPCNGRPNGAICGIGCDGTCWSGSCRY